MQIHLLVTHKLLRTHSKICQFRHQQIVLTKSFIENKVSRGTQAGQHQRTALIRVLSYRPHILLLNEPLGALDALTCLDIQNLIERIWTEQSFTAILVT